MVRRLDPRDRKTYVETSSDLIERANRAVKLSSEAVERAREVQIRIQEMRAARRGSPNGNSQ